MAAIREHLARMILWWAVATPLVAQLPQQGGKLVGTGASGQSYQGSGVALSADGNTAIVGGFADGNQAGATWVFTRTNGAWSQQGQKLVGSGGAGSNGWGQGYSVALSADGNTALVGGWFDSNGTGAVWVFTRSNGVWTQQGGKLVGSGYSSNGSPFEGYSVALSSDGNTALVGGYADNLSVGAAWVFTRTSGVWTQQGNKLIGSGATAAFEGISVALSSDGNTALVGGNGVGGGGFVFTRSNGVWTQQGGTLVGSGSVGAAQEGYAVALSGDGNTAVIAGRTDNKDVGAMWIFTRSNGSWSQVGSKLVGNGSVGQPYEGSSAAISSDGSTIAIGGVRDNGTVGAVWLFKLVSGAWTQIGSKMVGTGAVDGAFQGSAVALSSDGSTLIEGGSSDNDDVGAAWIFSTAGTLCDLNGADTPNVQLLINEALGGAPAANDLNGDGVVNVVDVQIEMIAALGLGCTVR